MGKNPLGIAFGNHRVYVANQGGNNVSVINPRSIYNARVYSSVAVGNEPSGVIYDPSNHLVCVSNFLSNSLSIINATTNILKTTLSVGSGPYGLAYDPHLSGIFVSDNTGNSFSEIIASSNQLLSTIRAG